MFAGTGGLIDLVETEKTQPDDQKFVSRTDPDHNYPRGLLMSVSFTELACEGVFEPADRHCFVFAVWV